MTKLTTLDGTLLSKHDQDGFTICYGGKDVLRFEKTGVILVEGVLVAQNRTAVYGLRELLKNIESGNFKQTE